MWIEPEKARVGPGNGFLNRGSDNTDLSIKHLFLEQCERLSESEETGPVRKPSRRGFCEHWLASMGVAFILRGVITFKLNRMGSTVEPHSAGP